MSISEKKRELMLKIKKENNGIIKKYNYLFIMNKDE